MSLPSPAPEDADLEVSWTDHGIAYRLTGRMGATGPLLTGVEITAEPGGFLFVTDLRAPLITTFASAFELTEGEIRRIPPQRGRPRHPEAAGNRLDEVARIARSATFGHRGKAVADWFGVSPSYARQLISKAGAAGHPIWR